MRSPPEEITVTVDGGTLPVVELLTGRGFVTGKSGSGKSVTASVIAEELLASDLSFLIVDTDGEYYGLKEHYEVLHVGADDTCDAQVGPEHASLLATMALEEDVPIILDVSGYLDTDEVDDLLERVARELFVREKDVKKPFLLVVEEAHEYLPESSGHGELGDRLLQIAKRGRKRGLGICAISQRPAAVDKDYITQCNWMVWHRLTWNNDTDVVRRIIDADAAEEVEELENGEAILMTDWDEQTRRVKFRMRETADVGQTPDFSEADVPDLRPVDPELVRRIRKASEGITDVTPEEDLGEDYEEEEADPSDGDGEAAEGDDQDEETDWSEDDHGESADDESGNGTERPGSTTPEQREPPTASARPRATRERSRSAPRPPRRRRDNVLLEVGDMMVYLFRSLHYKTSRAIAAVQDRIR